MELFLLFKFYKESCFQRLCALCGVCRRNLGISPTSRVAGLCVLLSNKAYAVLLDVAQILSTGTVPFASLSAACRVKDASQPPNGAGCQTFGFSNLIGRDDIAV